MERLGYLFYDGETANRRQRICQIAYFATDFEGNPVGDAVSQLIDPESDFGAVQTGIHGIGPADVLGMPNLARFCEDADFLDLLDRYLLVAHNALGADRHHIAKSLAAYGIPTPSIVCVDTMRMARLNHLPEALPDLCSHFGIPFDARRHHDALEDAIACSKAFWAMEDMFGHYTAGGLRHESGPGRRRVPRRTVPRGGLGTVHGGGQTIEDVLAEAERDGRRGTPGTIDRLDGFHVAVSGFAPGYTREQLRDALGGYGIKVGGKPTSKSNLLAIGDNAGQDKIRRAVDIGLPVMTIQELLEAVDRMVGDA